MRLRTAGLALSRGPAHFRFWHETDMPTPLRNVRSRGQSGKHLLASSFPVLTQNGREYDSGDAIQHPEWAFRTCSDVAIQV